MKLRRAFLERCVPALVILLAMLPAGLARAQSGTWTELPTDSSSAPGDRREFGTVYDPANERSLVFFGRLGPATSDYQLTNQVWQLSLSDTPTWTLLGIPGTKPGERHSPQWGYDAARNRVLVFGGYGSHYVGWNYEYLNDVWELDLDGTPKWHELFPAGQAPSGRLAGAAVYDPMRQRFVGFGGTIAEPVDTWVLNLRGQANWQPLPIDGDRPYGHWGMTSVYDARRDRMLIFGGSTDDGYYGANNDVWELTLRGLPEWHKLVVAGTPPSPRRSGAAIYDPIRDRMVVYGGFDAVPGSDAFLDDAYALDFSGSIPTWSALAPAGALPAGRDGVSAAYDPIHDRMILFGGWSGTSMLGDTQFLGWGDSGSAAVLSPSASATPTSAHLDWDVQDATGTPAAIYRLDPGGEWTALAEAEVDATGHVVFDDATVQAGTDYSYEMVVGSERGETFGGQTLVQVPTTLGVGPSPVAGLALERIAPNPAVEHMAVSFTLASAAPATLELMDVSGRRWSSQDVGSLGAGAHRVEFSSLDRMPAGLYFVRLAQGERVATSRVAISGGR